MTTSSPAASPSATLTHADGTLLRNGRPHRLLAGSLHYFRVHPGHWADRLRRLAALGLNTVDTYVPWNFHERTEGDIRFDGPRDLAGFVRLAQEEGLDVVVRPGPYICAEWDNGGLPAWLTGTPGMRLRTSHGPFLEAVDRWFDELIPRIADLQAGRGGPVVAVQIENEYGSYGDDHAYVRHVRDALVARGVTELLYTADGPTPLMQDGGALPGHLAAATFGSRPRQAAELLRSRRPAEPFLCAEFWNGWFDHWGEKHHVRPAAGAAETVGDILDEGGSVSLYMAHGGTNFGLWAGANHDGDRIRPTVTSYDSDAPIAENGALTPKFFALREKLTALDGSGPPRPLPAEPPVLTPRDLPVTRHAALLGALRASAEPVHAPLPLSFEELALDSGLVLYEAQPLLPPGNHELTVTGLHDRAQVYVDDAPVAVLERETATFTVPGNGARVRLALLVENQGRINYGPLLGLRKGILGGVRVERRLVHGWTMRPLPLDRWTPQDLARLAAAAPSDGRAGFATAVLSVAEPADAWVALPGFGKGFLWVNDALLGRYWEIGPQTTLYLPGPLLHPGDNTLTVLELERLGDRVTLHDRPDLGPPEEYVETFD
ncbi:MULTISPECIES: glycoside hydrolase family 35 protein [unclassified Streptomyces]|uniref:glycoside hydrolase family 35 protein n=1 Tax=unclassified Streptomyces TaxID=2593676 RepID=UPI0013CBD94B|nr:glycoside hydrolase family 35 protein [Streptomyces sp. HUAS CX7]NDZ76434.1 beta-galactosidase [Streptomyces sp. SID10362]WKX23101.1 beta-galactosidase [Streptomyces sp. HUAS CX7]